MKRMLVGIVLAGSAALAQPPVAPTNEPIGETRGTNTEGYNVVNSFEVGYRFHTVDGNAGTYRSDVNYGNGVRLLGSDLRVHSREGHGALFDDLVLTTQGLGGDPYQNATLRIGKNRLYSYDLLWRQDDYYNPALPITYGQHLLDTTRTMQDHNLTLLPDSKVRFFLGYSYNNQNGPALSTIQIPDSSGSEFPLFENVRRRVNEYRVGNEIRVAGFRLNWVRGWQDFKEDTPTESLTPGLGNTPDAGVSLNSFTRREPYHGTSPYWRVALFREGRSWYAMNGRFTYTAGRRNFILDESAVGASRFGGALNRQVLTYGDARRPVATGNLNLSLFFGDSLTLTNQTSVYSVRIDGDSTFRQLDNGTLSSDFVNFQYLGIRTVANQTELDYRPVRMLGLFAGYNYTNRRIRSIAQVEFSGATPFANNGEQTNELHAGTFGVRLKPVKGLTIVADGEIGRASQPIYPISDKDYHLLGARLLYRAKTLTISAYARANYNFNSTSLTAYSARTRDYAGSVSWTPSARFAVDAGYSKLHLDTLGGIAYFANGDFVTGDRSYYVSNIHAANATAHITLTRFADLYVGFSRVRDAGDGRATATSGPAYSTLPTFLAVQTFPLDFDSPLARLSLKLNKRVRWNVGYQFYRYREDFSTVENYRAHTGYTSLLWSF